MANFRSLSRGVLLEAGVKGWTLLEYREFYQSAIEFHGDVNVTRLVIYNQYLQPLQLLVALVAARPRIYLFSPRTLPQVYPIMILYALIISIFSLLFDLTVVCCLSDAPVRRWRHASITSTLFSGIIATLSDEKNLSNALPLSKVYAPYLLPISLSTSKRVADLSASTKKQRTILFSGWEYPERKLVFDFVKANLMAKDIPFVCSTRSLHGTRNTDQEYWQELCSHQIVFTTSMPMHERFSLGIDEYPHFIYRYFEALLAGALLICQFAPGSECYFKPGIHYIPYSSQSEAFKVLERAYCDYQSYAHIAKAGMQRAHTLASKYCFWSDLSECLMLKSCHNS